MIRGNIRTCLRCNKVFLSAKKDRQTCSEACKKWVFRHGGVEVVAKQTKAQSFLNLAKELSDLIIQADVLDLDEYIRGYDDLLGFEIDGQASDAKELAYKIRDILSE